MAGFVQLLSVPHFLARHDRCQTVVGVVEAEHIPAFSLPMANGSADTIDVHAVIRTVLCAIDMVLRVHLLDITQHEFMLFTFVHGLHHHTLVRDVAGREGDLSVIPMKTFVDLCLCRRHPGTEDQP